MRTFHQIGFILLCLMTSANCQGQSNVYSLSIYAGGVTYEHDWLIGAPPNQYGLSQYSQWEDSAGGVIIDAGHEKERGGTLRRYTRIYFSSRSFTVPLPAATVASLGIFILAAASLLLIVMIANRRKRHHHPI